MKAHQISFAMWMWAFFPSFAQEPAVGAGGELEKVRAQFDELAADTGRGILEFQNRYAGELQKLRGTAQAEGNLNLLIAVEEEIKGFQSGAIKSASQPELVRLQTIYASEIARLREERGSTLASLRKGYLKQLLELQIEMTRTNRIDEAMAVNAEVRNVEQLLKDGAAALEVSAGGEGAPTPENAGENRSPDAEKKTKRKNSEPLAEWLVGTIWKDRLLRKLAFETDGKVSLFGASGELSKGGTFAQGGEGDVAVNLDGGGNWKLEISEEGERLSDRTYSTTWVRLDHHEGALAKLTKRGLPSSARELERFLRGTAWSRNHSAKQPFLYEFDKGGNAFLSIWGQSWRNGTTFEAIDSRRLQIQDGFEVEFSEDFSTWRDVKDRFKGILIWVE